MNKALTLTNWNQGGRHYILNATSDNMWVGFWDSVISKLIKKFDDDFFLVIVVDKNKKNDDFYMIPFEKVKHVFTDEHKTTGKYRNRWTAVIIDDKFMMHANSQLAVDISSDYGNLHAADESLRARVNDDLLAGEIENEFFEGERKSRLSNYYERNPKLRLAAIKIHGFVCKVCDFDFKAFYGEHGSGFIEVHHLKPVSTLQLSTKIDPGKDMTVVCSNCHRMLHRDKDKILTLADLKRQLKKQ